MKIKILLVVMVSFLMGCVERHPVDIYYDEPVVRVKSIITADAQFAVPAKIIIEFENVGYDTAYDVSGYVDVEIGKKIIESVYFTIPAIRVGYTAKKEIILTSVNYHDEYDRYVLDFGWYDYYDHYYN